MLSTSKWALFILAPSEIAMDMPMAELLVSLNYLRGIHSNSNARYFFMQNNPRTIDENPTVDAM